MVMRGFRLWYETVQCQSPRELSSGKGLTDVYYIVAFSKWTYKCRAKGNSQIYAVFLAPSYICSDTGSFQTRTLQIVPDFSMTNQSAVEMLEPPPGQAQ